MKSLVDFTDQELLAELIRRNGVAEGPWATTYAELPVETLVSVDKDHTACIRMSPDEYKRLTEVTSLCEAPLA